MSTAAIIAHQQVQATRRNLARDLEVRTADLLLARGFTRVDKRRVLSPKDWPRPGEFCGECSVAGRQADLVVTLFDSRYMPLECKVSGSELNSIKRLDNDALSKFTKWRETFGRGGTTLPIAVIEGVFKLERLQDVQDAGARLVWGHDLAALGAFVDAAR